MELKDCRERIDAIDRELVRLFEARMGLAAEVAAYKKAHGLPVLQPAREEEKLDDLTAQVSDDLKEPLRELYATIFRLSRARQSSQVPLFPGTVPCERGNISYQAQQRA